MHAQGHGNGGLRHGSGERRVADRPNRIQVTWQEISTIDCAGRPFRDPGRKRRLETWLTTSLATMAPYAEASVGRLRSTLAPALTV